MLVLNQEIPVSTSDMLEAVKAQMYLEAYDDETRNFAKMYNDYLDEIFEIDEKLMEEVAERVDPCIVPVVSVNVQEFSQLKELKFAILTSDENYKLSTIDEKMIRDLCYERFKNVVPLMDRLVRYSKN